MKKVFLTLALGVCFVAVSNAQIETEKNEVQSTDVVTPKLEEAKVDEKTKKVDSTTIETPAQTLAKPETPESPAKPEEELQETPYIENK